MIKIKIIFTLIFLNLHSTEKSLLKKRKNPYHVKYGITTPKESLKDYSKKSKKYKNLKSDPNSYKKTPDSFRLHWFNFLKNEIFPKYCTIISNEEIIKLKKDGFLERHYSIVSFLPNYPNGKIFCLNHKIDPFYAEELFHTKNGVISWKLYKTYRQENKPKDIEQLIFYNKIGKSFLISSNNALKINFENEAENFIKKNELKKEYISL